MSPSTPLDRTLTRLVDAGWTGVAVAVSADAMTDLPLLGLTGIGVITGVAVLAGSSILARRGRARPTTVARRTVARRTVRACAVLLAPLSLVLVAGLVGDPSIGGLVVALLALASRSLVLGAVDAAHHDRLGHEASRDALTGLLNRRAVLDALAVGTTGSNETGTTTVLLLDLDGFKGINDLHGHHAGDQVLVTVARRLMSSVRPTDAVGRLGGDEFVVVTRDHDPHALARRIRAEIVEPLDWQRFSLKVGCSVGVCRDETDGVELSGERLLDRADQALYRAKDLGGNVVVDIDLDDPVGGADEPASRPAKRHAAKRSRLGVG